MSPIRPLAAAVLLASACSSAPPPREEYALVVTFAGDGSGSVLAAGLSCIAGRCEGRYPQGAIVRLTAVPDDGSDLVGWQGPCDAGECAISMTEDRTLVATFMRRVRVMLRERVLGGGAGRVAASDVLACEVDSCEVTARVPWGRRMSFTASPGEQTLFRWEGACGGTASPCELDATADLEVTAVFNGANYVFVTSSQVPAAMGGLVAADAECAARARAAGLPGTFVAWLGSAGRNAGARLGTARGWIRVDGEPFADSVASLTSGCTVFYPPRLDEHGREADGAVVHTGAMPDGVVSWSGTCGDWTSTEGLHHGGDPTQGSGGWTSFHGGLSCLEPARLYCFGVDLARPVSPPPAEGRVAFLSAGSLRTDGGLAAADALCAAEADAAGLAGSYRALLATTGESAASRFDLTGLPWVRPDGARIVASASDLLGERLVAPIAVLATGEYPGWNHRVWTGASGSGTPGEDATSCSAWSTTAGLGSVGVWSATDRTWFGNYMRVGCFQPPLVENAVYCLQE